MKPSKFVLSKKRVLEQYNQLKDLVDTISYSSKTNQDVTKILEKNTGSLFSVHFVNELKHVTDMKRVIFLAQAWNKKDIALLMDKGITSFIVDNESDLDKLLQYLDTSTKKITLFLRIKLKENTIKTERYFVFGMNSKTVNARIPTLADHPRIEYLGIHFHRKTQNMSEWDLVFELDQSIEKENWQYLEWVNIGGGLPAHYANTNQDVLPSILKRISEFRSWLKEKKTRLMIEPGRFIAASAVRLETRILSIAENTITVNASVYNSDMDALVVPVKLLVENELPKEQGTPYVIKGVTPCSMDLFRYRVYLDNPKVGDRLVFLNAGAYNFTTDFCDLEKIPTEVVD